MEPFYSRLQKCLVYVLSAYETHESSPFLTGGTGTFRFTFKKTIMSLSIKLYQKTVPVYLRQTRFKVTNEVFIFS